MKKRICSAFLSGVLCTALCTSVFAADSNLIQMESDVSGLTPEMAQAYLDVLDAHINRFGGYSQWNVTDYGSFSQGEMTPGVIGGFLRDWDGNGIPELYLADVTTIDLNMPRDEVWTWNGSKAIRLYATPDPNDDQMNTSTGYYWMSGNGRAWSGCSLYESAGRLYLANTVEYLSIEEPDDETDTVLYAVEGTRWVKVAEDSYQNPDTANVLEQYGRKNAKELLSGCGQKVYLKNNAAQLRELLKQAAEPIVGSFRDVKISDYFAEPVAWAVEKGITYGVTTTAFVPHNTCTNAEILSFLWRAEGSPVSTIRNPFSNVQGDEYYAQAAVWAFEKGMISGDTFAASQNCTRAMTMEYFWKLHGCPSAAATDKFKDVPANAPYAEAVAWAVTNGITFGTTDTTFSPDSTCTRAQIVSYLYRMEESMG